MLNEGNRARALVALAAIAWAGTGVAGATNRYSAAAKTCEAVINEDVEDEFPKAKNVAWNWDSVSEKETRNGIKFAGQGTYKGSDKQRTYDLECVYDTEEDRVTSAWWRSSFDNVRHTVVAPPSDTPSEGPTEAAVTSACERAVDATVREDFEHKIRKVELVEDSIERSERQETHKLEGQGRFLGGGGNWHRFDFTCTYDEDDEEVTDATWKHLGDERDLDLD